MNKKIKIIAVGLAVLSTGLFVAHTLRKKEIVMEEDAPVEDDPGQGANWSRSDDFFSSFTADDEFFGLEGYGSYFKRWKSYWKNNPIKPKKPIKIPSLAGG